MSVVRRSDGLLPREIFIQAVDFIRQGVEDRASLVETLRIAAAVASNRTYNTIETLREIGAIVIDDDGHCACLIGPTKTTASIRRLLLDHYFGLLDGLPATGLFQLDLDRRGLKVSAAHLPGRAHCYPYALLEFGVFQRGGWDEPFWTVADDVVPRVMAWLEKRNLNATGRLFSLDDLKSAQHAREVAGKIAEEWALDWEKTRLAGHSFLNSVRSISDENAAAGFDILSFDGLRTLSHDRFIEVKSYADEFSFFWSEGEIKAARRFRMRYWLYLVDRRRMPSAGYKPELIQDPVGYFIDRDPIGWSVSAQGLKFTRVAV